jgi:acyl-CoA dehydrogenase
VLSRYAASFAITADLALLTLGGALKRKEMLSARFGGLLSELYLLSAVLKRFEEEGRQDSDLPLLDYCMEKGFAEFERTLDAILVNFPNRFAAAILRLLTLPFGVRRRGPSDAVIRRVAALIQDNTPTRARLTAGIAHGTGDDGMARLDKAFRSVLAAAPVARKMHDAHERDWRRAEAKGVISDAEARQLQAMQEAVALANSVDDFAPEELSPRTP